MQTHDALSHSRKAPKKTPLKSVAITQGCVQSQSSSIDSAHTIPPLKPSMLWHHRVPKAFLSSASKMLG